MNRSTIAVITGLLGMLVGFLLISVFAPPIIDNFATTGGGANLPSFSGGKAFNDMFVLFYYIFALVVILGSGVLAGMGVRNLRRG